MNRFLLCVLLSLSLCACDTVLKQSIPVSTNPLGAQVYADGKAQCMTPCNVELARNQDHLLTFTKDGYKQQDVAIKRQYQQEKTLVNAINSGIQSGSFFKDTAWGINSGVQSMQRQEETGEAYILKPSTVTVKMTPNGGFPQQTTQKQADKATGHYNSPLEMMQPSDEHMLENTLEMQATGTTKIWTNDKTGIKFAVLPEDATVDAGQTVRAFTIAASYNGDHSARSYKAYRVGRGEWQVAVPNQQDNNNDATDQDQKQETAEETPDVAPVTGKETLRALGDLNWPSYQKSTTLGKSSHSSTTMNSDGSVTRKSSSSSVKAGVSVSPGAVFKLLDALDGDEK